MKRVFVSFNYCEDKHAGDLLQFFRPNGGPVDAEPVRLPKNEALPGADEIERRIGERMATCSGLVVVVGDVAHNKPWSAKEVEIAKSMGLPRVGVRISGSRGGPPGADPGLAFVDWDPERLAAHVAGWPRRGALRWDPVPSEWSGGGSTSANFSRARVPGGWLVHLVEFEGDALTFVLDAGGLWAPEPASAAERGGG